MRQAAAIVAVAEAAEARKTGYLADTESRQMPFRSSSSHGVKYKFIL
jgi:hypothetical protein